MIEGLIDLAPNVRQRLIEALEAGVLAAPYTQASLRSSLGGSGDMQAAALLASLTKFSELGVPGRGVAGWLRALEKLDGRAPRTDLVWSGPEVRGLHARDTRRVYEELLGTAEHSAWVSSFVFFDGPKAFQVLARRMAEVQELEVTLLLNVQRKKGDTTTADSLIRRFAERFWTADWPGSRKPRVFYDPRSVELEGGGGVLHAKAVVTDEYNSFVTSANLTEHALDKNVEVGLLHRDRALALSLVRYFRELIETGRLQLLPDH